MPALISTILSPRSAWTTSDEPLSDESILNRIAAGDKLAMRILFARHQVLIFRFVLRLLRDEAMAEDAVSEVFLHVWRQAGRFGARSSVSTWMLAIARNTAISALRSRKEAEWDAQSASFIIDVSDDPEVAFAKKDTGAVMRKCVEHLSAEHREIIDLVYYHEQSIEEVAQIVGIPANTVKTRMFYARRHLRELLQQFEIGGVVSYVSA
jgi:RNA polymerase sigma-70 factor (ECF subfamily)